VLGPAASVCAALSYLEQSSACDAAVLDINLGSETSEPIARKLLDAGIPFIAISGYSREQLPSIFDGERFRAKPLNYAQLLDDLVQITRRGQPAPPPELRSLSI
jgi:hypothetical protein